MTIKPFDTSKLRIDRGKLMKSVDAGFKRYQITTDGVSPRSIPGQANGFFVSTSYEHAEDSFSSEESSMRIAQVDKRARKIDNITEEEIEPKVYGEKTADLTIVSWGSNKGMVLEAMKWLKNDGYKVNFLQILWINPFPIKRVSEILSKSKKLLMVEQNKEAQMRGLIRERTGYYIEDTLLRYDGRPLDPEDIYARAKVMLG
jgi:2-oxoglutarate ferredoxin oxidoreductase subunit alpha